MRVWALLAAGLQACAAADASVQEPAGAERRAAESELAVRPPDAPPEAPAPGPYPTPPGIDFAGDEPPPPDARLARDAALVGRLTRTDERALVRFEAREGELSLLELTAWGYARGWEATSRLVVRDEEGRELARSVRKGGAVFQDLLPFVAPRAGTFTLEIGAESQYFRYLLVRHSSFAVPREREVVAVPPAAAGPSHGWLAGERSEARFLVTGEPGELIALRAEPTHERGWKHKRSLRQRAARATFAGERLLRRLAAEDPRERDDRSFPDLALRVEDAASPGEEVPRIAGAGFSAVARVPESGRLLVTVARTDEGPGGLFDLFVERGLPFGERTIRVGDADDEPVAGAMVALLREPALDRFGVIATDEAGEATFLAPPGSYTVVFGRRGEPAEVVRTEVPAGEVVNVVLAAGR